MRNDPRALKLILSLVDRYADAPDIESRIEDLLAEEPEILARYLGKPSPFSADGDEPRDVGNADDDKQR